MNNFRSLTEKSGRQYEFLGEDREIRLFGIVRESIVDGPGLRFVIFVQGCPHHCHGCHNPASHDPLGGKVTSTLKIWNEIIKNPLITGITFSGGEPFLWASELAQIGESARNAGLDVMTYTGYKYENLVEAARYDKGTKALLSASNYLVDGLYVEEERDLTLKFRGSRNQKIYDITCYPNSVQATEIDFDNKILPYSERKSEFGYEYRK